MRYAFPARSQRRPALVARTRRALAGVAGAGEARLGPALEVMQSYGGDKAWIAWIERSRSAVATGGLAVGRVEPRKGYKGWEPPSDLWLERGYGYAEGRGS